MSSVGNLQDILEKIRELTGAGNSLNMTTEKVVKMLNSAYLYDIPDSMRTLQLKDMYTFNTVQGLQTYPFDYDSWDTIEAPVYCRKQQMTLYQDPQSFYGNSFYIQRDYTFDSADGTAGPYGGTLLGTPILPSINNNAAVSTPLPNTSVFPVGFPSASAAPNNYRVQNILITANTETGSLHVSDDGDGNLIGDAVAGGTIDYRTGEIENLTFTSTVPAGNPISAQYLTATEGQPLSIMFFQNQFTVTPVPDKAYTIEMVAYRNPSQALLGTNNPSAPVLSGRPELYDWWEMLAFMVAKKIFQNRGDTEGVALMQAYIDEKKDEALTRTYAQLGKQRMGTIYAEQMTQQPNYGWGPNIGG